MDSSNTTSHTTTEPESKPTFPRNHQMDQTAAPPERSHDIPAVENLSAAAARPVGQGIIRRRRRKTHVRGRISGEACGGGGGGEESSTYDDDDDDDEKTEVGKKIAALKRIVPGGERLEVEELFEETAEYIFKLECQVKLLRFLAAFLQRSDDDEHKKRKHGS